MQLLRFFGQETFHIAFVKILIHISDLNLFEVNLRMHRDETQMKHQKLAE